MKVNDNHSISKFGYMFLMVSVTIGAEFLSLPRVATHYMGKNGWWLVLLSVILFLGIWVMTTLIRLRFLDETYIQYMKKTLGRPISVLLSILLLGFLIFFLTYELDMLVELSNIYLVKRTPPFLLMLVFIFATIPVLRGGCESLARFCFLTFPISFMIWFIVVLLGTKQGDLSNILPVTLPQSSWHYFLKGMVEISAPSYGWSVFLIILVPYVRKKDRGDLLKYTIMGAGIIALVYAGSIIACLGYFGFGETLHLMYPLVALVRSIDPGLTKVIERPEIFFVALWIATIFTTFIIVFFTLQVGISEFFELREYKLWFAPIIPWVFLIALIPDNMIQDMVMWEYVNMIYIALVFTIIPVQFLMTRKRKIGVPYQQVKREAEALKKQEQEQLKAKPNYQVQRK